jgi:protocadherin Fat 4
VSVSENKQVGEEVTRVSTAPNDKVTYEMTGEGTAVQFFNIDATQGIIRLGKSLKNDTTKLKAYRLNIKATRVFEVNTQFAVTSVIVTVTRNEYTPQFTQGEYRKDALSEKTLVGTSILRVNAYDRDGDKLVYEMVTKEPETSSFYLNPMSGVLTLARVLSMDALIEYRFSVIVRDQSVPEKTATAGIYVQMKRDLQKPSFDGVPYSKTISEKLQPGTSVFRLAGRDDDKMGNLRYDITGVVPAPYYFVINKETGEVYVMNSLMADKSFNYTVSAIVYDDANPEQTTSTNLTINVKRNENKPKFMQNDYSVKVLEIVPVGSIITQVRATDSDGVSTTSNITYLCSNPAFF